MGCFLLGSREPRPSWRIPPETSWSPPLGGRGYVLQRLHSFFWSYARCGGA
jgi:hypothetical protein